MRVFDHFHSTWRQTCVPKFTGQFISKKSLLSALSTLVQWTRGAGFDQNCLWSSFVPLSCRLQRKLWDFCFVFSIEMNNMADWHFCFFFHLSLHDISQASEVRPAIVFSGCCTCSLMALLTWNISWQGRSDFFFNFKEMVESPSCGCWPSRACSCGSCYFDVLSLQTTAFCFFANCLETSTVFEQVVDLCIGANQHCRRQVLVTFSRVPRNIPCHPLTHFVQAPSSLPTKETVLVASWWGMLCENPVSDSESFCAKTWRGIQILLNLETDASPVNQARKRNWEFLTDTVCWTAWKHKSSPRRCSAAEYGMGCLVCSVRMSTVLQISTCFCPLGKIVSFLNLPRRSHLCEKVKVAPSSCFSVVG